MKPAVVILLAALAPAVPAPGALAQAQGFDAFPPDAPAPAQPQPRAPAPRQPAAPAQPAPPPAPAPAPDVWVAQSFVELVALDKVSGRSTPLHGRVGQELHFGTLTLLAPACVVRPPVAAPDAAAFVEISDARPGGKPFRAWMLLSEPAVSIFEHPVYDIRFMGCRAAP